MFGTVLTKMARTRRGKLGDGEEGAGDSEDNQTSNILFNTRSTLKTEPPCSRNNNALLTGTPLSVDVCLHPHAAWGEKLFSKRNKNLCY